MTTFLISLLMASGALANDTIPAGCTSSRNFSAEAYKTWISEGNKQSTSEDAVHSSPISIEKRTELQLITSGSESKGFVNFEIPAAGEYVIATDFYPRIDLIDVSSGENLSPIDYGKVRDCGSVNKALRFQFSKPGKFHLGFISNQGPLLNVLIFSSPHFQPPGTNP